MLMKDAAMIANTPGRPIKDGPVFYAFGAKKPGGKALYAASEKVK